MKPRRLLTRLRGGDLRNVRFSDFCALVEMTGFTLIRVRESHCIYGHPAAGLILNLQDADGYAKPHQIRQFLRTTTRYALDLRGADERLPHQHLLQQ